MMPDNKNKGRKVKAGMILAAAILAVAYLAFITYQAQLEKRKREQPREFVVFSHLPAATQIDALLETREGAVPLTVEGNTIVLSEEQRTNFYLPFKLTVHIEEKSGKYYDLLFTLDSLGVNYAVTLEGFKPNERIAITMNGAESSGVDYTDWSGRYVANMVFNLGESMSACLDIKAQPAFGFCQTFPVRDEVK